MLSLQVGVLNDVMTNAENIVAKGRLGPGQMVVADLQVCGIRTSLAICMASQT
jgi:hypothetical protein